MVAALARANDLQTTFTSLNVELGKLAAIMIIPKAIREMSLPFVDRYFTAVLQQCLNEGIEDGYINGTGVDMPFGITKNITNGVASDKVAVTITDLSIRGLGAHLGTLSNNGKRTVQDLAIVCNPLDYFSYILPGIMCQTTSGLWTDSTGLGIKVYQSTKCAQGTAILTMAHKYTMAFSGINIKDYDQTLALDDADLVIGKVYGNGKPVDNNCSIVFTPSAVIPAYVNVKTVTEPAG